MRPRALFFGQEADSPAVETNCPEQQWKHGASYCVTLLAAVIQDSLTPIVQWPSLLQACALQSVALCADFWEGDVHFGEVSMRTWGHVMPATKLRLISWEWVQTGPRSQEISSFNHWSVKWIMETFSWITFFSSILWILCRWTVRGVLSYGQFSKCYFLGKCCFLATQKPFSFLSSFSSQLPFIKSSPDASYHPELTHLLFLTLL